MDDTEDGNLRFAGFSEVKLARVRSEECLHDNNATT